MVQNTLLNFLHTPASTSFLAARALPPATKPSTASQQSFARLPAAAHCSKRNIFVRASKQRVRPSELALVSLTHVQHLALQPAISVPSVLSSMRDPPVNIETATQLHTPARVLGRRRADSRRPHACVVFFRITTRLCVNVCNHVYGNENNTKEKKRPAVRLWFSVLLFVEAAKQQREEVEADSSRTPFSSERRASRRHVELHFEPDFARLVSMSMFRKVSCIVSVAQPT